MATWLAPSSWRFPHLNAFRAPWFWFLTQCMVLAAVLAVSGRFKPVRVPDTPSYEMFPFASPLEALSYSRTIGYPLLLKLGGLVAGRHAAVPPLHYLLHVLAVGVFWLGLRNLIPSDWTSMLVAGSLLYSHLVFRYVNNLAADCAGCSLAILSIGLLLVAILGSGSRWSWWALAGSIFAAYQVRPAYLFLVVLVPPLGAMLAWLAGPAPPRSWRRLILTLAAAAALPLAAFGAVRWLAVGQFSLVSFGGCNFAGVVSALMDAGDPARFPAEVRPLAEAVLRRRAELAASDPQYSPGPHSSYIQIENAFNANTWQIGVPAAQEVYGDDWREIDGRLWQLAVAIVAEHPLRYGVWLAKAFVRGVYMIVSEYIMNPVYFALLALLLGAHGLCVVLRKRRGIDGAAGGVDFVPPSSVLLIAVSFALAKLLLVIVTSPPLGRFMDAAGVFLACVLAEAVLSRFREVAGGGSSRFGPAPEPFSNETKCRRQAAHPG
jgi:hypothetical protein